MIVACMALTVALGGTALAASQTGGSGPLKVCVATKEGKPILTPKGGVCKKGYTLTEVNKEGPEGKAGPQGVRGEPGPEGKMGGASLERHELLATPFEIPNDPAGHLRETEVPLVNASWTQNDSEVDEVVGRATFMAPKKSECPGFSYIAFTVDGVEDGAYEPQETESPHEESVRFTVHDPEEQEIGGHLEWWIPTASVTTHTISALGISDCGVGATGVVKVIAINLDIIRTPE